MNGQVLIGLSFLLGQLRKTLKLDECLRALAEAIVEEAS